MRNHRILISRSELGSVANLLDRVSFEAGSEPLRWFVADVTDDVVIVEATTHEQSPSDRVVLKDDWIPTGRSIVVNIVPTGIGCAVGGFAGDAAPATALLAATGDLLVTNPNAVNASNFVHLSPNTLYTEGYMIDQWLRGLLSLYRPSGNRVGVIIEQCEPDVFSNILQIVEVARGVYGVDIIGYTVTDGPIGTTCVLNTSGAYVGTVREPDELLRATERLMSRGANAIAVTSQIRGFERERYLAHFKGAAPNPVGGAEAIVSHLVVRAFRVPCAHAPIVNYRDFQLGDLEIDPRSAGELASETGLACVLIGLRQAPQIRPEWGCEPLARADVRAVVAPATAMGGIAVLAAASLGVPVIAVEENYSVLKVTAEALGMTGVLEAASYPEAAGLLLALRHGISIDGLRRPLYPVERFR